MQAAQVVLISQDVNGQAQHLLSWHAQLEQHCLQVSAANFVQVNIRQQYQKSEPSFFGLTKYETPSPACSAAQDLVSLKYRKDSDTSFEGL